MNEHEIVIEMAELNKRTKAIWPSGWAALTFGQDGEWWLFIYDDQINGTPFKGSTVMGAISQASEHLVRNPPMTKARLAAILGIEVAA